MEVAGATTSTAAHQEIRLLLRQFQTEATLALLPALYLAGVGLFFVAHRFRELHLGIYASQLLCLLAIAVWALQRWRRLVAAWTLIIGCSIVALLIARWAGVDVALFLLILPAGFAMITVSTMAGTLFALAWSLPLLFAPASLLPGGSVLRFITLLGLWSTVGLIWLSRRPMLTALEWAWSGYEQSRQLLEQARDYRLQIKQTMEDLADANLQLTRLNRLAQGLRQAAEEARQAKEQFVARVSHELRTPLNMIIGFSEMVVRAPQTYGKRLPPALLADLAVILRNSEHLAGLINDVLDLSQIEAGKMALTKERVSLGEIIEAAATAVRPLFDAKGLQMEIETADDLPPVLCDRTRMREVVLNLLSNAGRFTERGGVRVRAVRVGQEVELSVSDTGPGISAEHMAKLFEPFEHGDGSIRYRFGGTGLGLAVSKRIIELHGGRIWVESEVGVGSTFYLRLPIDTPAAAGDNIWRWFSPFWRYEERTRQSLAPTPVLRPRFVVLEKRPCLQRLLARYEDGAEIAAVLTLEEALQELERVPAQALLINALSVSEVLERLNDSVTLPDGIPVLVCSVPGIAESADALAASDYLVKPIARETLLATLDRLELKGRTVLVVDDEPEAARLLQRMLYSASPAYRVLRAGNGRQALTILRQQHVDVVLLDLLMPEMDGFQFLEARSQDPALSAVPVVVVSARDPGGQPIVASALAVSRSGGLSVGQLLSCIRALSALLSPISPSADRELREKPSG